MGAADIELCIGRLLQAAEDVEQARGDKRRVVARLLTFARLLRAPILVAALRDLNQSDAVADVARVVKVEQGTLEAIGRAFYELRDVWRTDGSFRDLVESRRAAIAVATDPLVTFLGQVATPRGDSPDELSLSLAGGICTDAAPRALELLRPTGPVLWWSNVRHQLEKLRDLGATATRCGEFRTQILLGSPAPLASRFAEFLETWEQRLDKGPTDATWSVPRPNGLERDARSLANQLRLFLNGQRSRQIVLQRAKVFFEHFYCDEARAAIGAEEERDGNARKEYALRRQLDRFVFQEGFFPITEGDASRGNIDLLLDDAERSGVPPLLAEVKQVVRIADDTVRASEVEAAIRAADPELNRYRNHLRAHPRMDFVEPFIVVFHTSVDDTSRLQRDGVVLIDVGSRSPSLVRPSKARHEVAG